MSRASRIALVLAAGLALADASIVTLGLPAILVDLESTVEGVALVLGVYTAVLALALPLASRLAGRIGAAPLAMAGAAVFGISSAICGLADSLAPLLVMRAVQALGGAAVLVAAFELLGAGVPGPGRRLWVAASVFGIAVGPALGGALTQAFDWRAIFLAQVPIAAAGLAAGWTARGLGRPPTDGDEPGSPVPVRPAIALALLSAALTAVVFLVVLLLVSGWSVEPITAALVVTVLPVAAIAASRLPGNPETRAATGCLLVAGGVGCLALLPAASSWWTVVPQLLAGAGMGLALPALSGELIAERNRTDASRLLSVRHAGIALALAALAPIISSSLDTEVTSAREQGTAAVLDAELPPETKIGIAPELLGGVDTDDPRGELERSVAEAREGLEGDEEAELDRIAGSLDKLITDGVRDAFRIAFIISAALALTGALVLVSGAPGAGRAATAAVAAAFAAGAIAIGAYAVRFANTEEERVALADPCQGRELPDTGGIGGFLQDESLAALDRAACEFGSGREELLLALIDAELREEFEEEHGVDPTSIAELGPALFGL